MLEKSARAISIRCRVGLIPCRRSSAELRQTAERYMNAWMYCEPAWYFVVNVIPEVWLSLVLGLPWLVSAWRRQFV